MFKRVNKTLKCYVTSIMKLTLMTASIGLSLFFICYDINYGSQLFVLG